MKIWPLLIAALCLAYPAAAKPRVAVLNVQQAIASTEDGKAASAAMQRKFGAQQERLSGEHHEIELLKQQLDRGDLTAEEAASLKARIATLTQKHQRLQEDFEYEVQEEQKRLLKDLNTKLLPVVEKYARKKHFEVVLDIGDPKTPVYWRATATDITHEIVKQYDQAGGRH